ncbi:hypothetical protein DRN34_01475 [Thermococci archaeon]|nr:MAG: hypothetical protein DRN34_01475 [Thermococci archaeon]
MSFVDGLAHERMDKEHKERKAKYKSLRRHVGHKIVCVVNKDYTIIVKCKTCNVVISSYDKE